MAEKKYYWLKLKEDFFRQKEIKKLRKIAGGDTFTIIYLKLQLLSLKDEGKLFFEGVEESFIDEMALELDEEVENVRLTILYLQQHDLIQLHSDNEYSLPETIASIGSETDSAERARRHRGKQKALLCNGHETISNTEIEIEIEKELDIDKEKESKSKTVAKKDTLREQISNSDLPSMLKDKVNDWLSYKEEKKDGYKPTGFKSLMTQIKNNSDRYGEAAVITLIDECMASNWKGIIWDRIKEAPSLPNVDTKEIENKGPQKSSYEGRYDD